MSGRNLLTFGSNLLFSLVGWKMEAEGSSEMLENFCHAAWC